MIKAPYAQVKTARESDLPTGLDYIRNVFSDFAELHGDRRFGDDAAVVAGIVGLGELPVTVIAMERGHTAKERVARSFCSPNSEGYRKAALRLKNLLTDYGISEIVENVDGKRRIVPSKIQCNLYDYLTGKETYAGLFKGSYLSNYSWSETTLAELTGEILGL